MFSRVSEWAIVQALYTGAKCREALMNSRECLILRERALFSDQFIPLFSLKNLKPNSELATFWLEPILLLSRVNQGELK